ncbi:MAG: hypothetical protein DI537_47765 [Stutzerimonas stutzeri]|nr:MAG: hypothetical protein DI537_47765 [Stutzerimonas stutzeri]
MRCMSTAIAKLDNVRDNQGHQWVTTLGNGGRPKLEVGTVVQIEAVASGDVLYGFAVGDDTVAVSEWSDHGTFEFHVLERYAGKTVVLHVAVRRHGTVGKRHSDWLAEVDDFWVIQYEVAAEDARA